MDFYGEQSNTDIKEALYDCKLHFSKSTNITKIYKIPDDLPKAKIDNDLIREVFFNIIRNALDSGGKKIDITASHTRRQVVIKIRDNGKGIQAHDLKYTFDPYWTKDKSHGTGLGLYICNEVIKAAGGEIKVKSTPGKGTTFTISLPAISDTTSHGEKASSSGETKKLIGEIILNWTHSLERLEKLCRQEKGYAELFLKNVNSVEMAQEGMTQKVKAKLFANILLYWAGLPEERRTEFPFKPKWYNDPEHLGTGGITLTPDVWFVIQPYQHMQDLPNTVESARIAALVESSDYVDRKGRIAIETVLEKADIIGSPEEALIRKATAAKSEIHQIDTSWVMSALERRDPGEITAAKRVLDAIVDIRNSISLYAINNGIRTIASHTPFTKSFLWVNVFFGFPGKTPDELIVYHSAAVVETLRVRALYFLHIGEVDCAVLDFTNLLARFPGDSETIALLLVDHITSEKGQGVTASGKTLSQVCLAVALELKSTDVCAQVSFLLGQHASKRELAESAAVTAIDSAA